MQNSASFKAMKTKFNNYTVALDVDILFNAQFEIISVWACIYHLNPSMAAQVEVKLRRVCDGAVHCGASWYVTALPNLQGQSHRL